MGGEALLPQLDEAQKALVVALEEACAADLDKLDTPELIRIEETLDVASKAAKEAVSMRLRIDAQPGLAERHKAKDAVPDTDASKGVPHRVIRDGQGKQWHVFAVHATSPQSGKTALPAAFQAGWLVFDSADEVRRIAPIPAGWEALSVEKLRDLCGCTSGSPKRKGHSERPGPGAAGHSAR